MPLLFQNSKQIGFVLLTIAVAGTLAFAGENPAPAIPAPPQNISPGIENGPWVVEKWGNPGTATWLNDRKVMKLTYTGGDKEKAAEALVTATKKLDKAASKGVIHANQAANKKSALAKSVNGL